MMFMRFANTKSKIISKRNDGIENYGTERMVTLKGMIKWFVQFEN